MDDNTSQQARFLAIPDQDATVTIGLSIEGEDDIVVTLDVDAAEEFALQILGAVTLSSYFAIVRSNETEKENN